MLDNTHDSYLRKHNKLATRMGFKDEEVMYCEGLVHP